MDDSIAALLEGRQKPLVSYEFFPPKTEKAVSLLEQTLSHLSGTAPDFVTVTYGAGGSTRETTLEVAHRLRDVFKVPVMPHLTCVGADTAQLRDTARRFEAEGFRNIMALRGDPPQGDATFTPAADGPAYANELVSLLKAVSPACCCGVAAYPEVHPEAPSAEEDLLNLKRKVDAGAGFITTQLFFENDVFYRFRDRCVAAGIDLPILPGLLPATQLSQVERFSSMCGAAFPEALRARMQAAGDQAAEAGYDWCREQFDDLIGNDVPGVHLYILNRSRAPLALRLR